MCVRQLCRGLRVWSCDILAFHALNDYVTQFAGVNELRDYLALRAAAVLGLQVVQMLCFYLPSAGFGLILEKAFHPRPLR